MVELGLVLGGVLGLLFFCGIVVRWNDLKHSGKGFPEGTMGWPLLGETIQFLKHGHSFMKNHRSRHGNIFKTHILWFPTVVSMDQDVNRFILMNEGKGLHPAYPQSMLDILGKWHITGIHGALHKSMRGALLSLIGPSAIRDQLLPKTDAFMRFFLSGWSGQTVNVQQKTREMTCMMALKLIAGIETGQLADSLKEEFFKLFQGTLSLPISLPGTSYHRAFQARKKIVSIFRDVLEERRSSSVDENGDILCSLLQADAKTASQLTDEQMIDLLITIVYTGYETVSATLMMAIKYLHDHPSALQEARDEHLEIRKRKSTGEAIDWEDYKSMNFTRAVIFETMRLATIISGVLRRTTEDLVIKGFTIPRGWKIYVYMGESNYDPFQYPEPLQFNPWRWKDKSLETQQSFTPFGGGSRLCPGKELGMVEVSTFLHYFLTRYRCEELGGEEILQFPRVEAPKGLHFRVWDT